MEETETATLITAILAFTAGFSDATTFVAANELFSAHVTGNFILFAYDIVKGADAGAWLKLLSFPVFVVAVMLAGRISLKANNTYLLLSIECVILLVSSMMALALKSTDGTLTWMNNTVAMLIVFAMAFQNAFGRVHAKTLLATTTVMTGNVTQAALDVVSVFFVKHQDPAKAKSLKNQFLIIMIFLTGCLLGGELAQIFGLCVVGIPGVIMTIYLLKKQSLKIKNTSY